MRKIVFGAVALACLGLSGAAMAESRWPATARLYFIEPADGAVVHGKVMVKFDLSDRVRGPSIERAQRHTLEINGGWKVVDDIRGEEGLPPLPNGIGQIPWRPLNFAPANSPTFLDPNLKSGGIGGGIENDPDAPPAPNTDGF